MKITEIHAKSIISKSNLPEADFVINPYVGCSHSCIYCYARFMKRFTGHTEDWGTFVDVKINAPELIPKDNRKFHGKTILLSSVTDPYMPVEAKYRLTRRILERLLPLQPRLSMLTKSDLVVRDIDIIKCFKNAEVGLTITSLDDEVRKEIEPFASPVNSRLRAIRELKAAGIRTYAFIGPILPHITDWKAIVDAAGADFYMFENLNTAGAIGDSVNSWITKYHPELAEMYRGITRRYWDNVEQEIISHCLKRGLKHKVFFHH